MIRRLFMFLLLAGGAEAAPKKKRPTAVKRRLEPDQCPVCSTVAEPYRSLAWNLDAPIKRLVDCQLCRCAFYQDRVSI